MGYISRFLQLFRSVFYSENTPKFWLTWIWTKGFAIICFMKGRLVNVWTLELTLWYLDCEYTSCGELACGVLMQTIKTNKERIKSAFKKISFSIWLKQSRNSNNFVVKVHTCQNYLLVWKPSIQSPQFSSTTDAVT